MVLEWIYVEPKERNYRNEKKTKGANYSMAVSVGNLIQIATHSYLNQPNGKPVKIKPQ